MTINRRELLMASTLAAAGGDGASAVSQSRASTGSPFVSLAEFGGIGDGKTDNTTALDSAIRHCLAANVALYIPSGHYLHNSLVITPATRQSIKIFGDWAYDVYPASYGTFLIHQGNGSAVTIGGGSGPFPSLFEGICFCSSSQSDAGLRIIGRSDLNFHRCGWINNRSKMSAAVHITKTDHEFVGVVTFTDCRFFSCSCGVLVDSKMTNVLSISFSRFIDVDISLSVVKNASCRSTSVQNCHFENSQNLRSVVRVDGSVFSFNFCNNYIEQNSSNLDDPLIFFTRSQSGEISRNIIIKENFFQKKLNSPNTSIIYLEEVQGAKIHDNFHADGEELDRYWCKISKSASEVIVNLPFTPNGVKPYPIYNSRLDKVFNRDHSSEESRLAESCKFNLTDVVPKSEKSQCSFTKNTFGEIYIIFDLCCHVLKDTTENVALEIVNLPFTPDGECYFFEIIEAQGFPVHLLPLSAKIPRGSTAIKIFDRAGNHIPAVALRGSLISLSACGRYIYQ